MADTADKTEAEDEGRQDMRCGLNYLRQDLHEHREATAREFESIRSRFVRMDDRFDRMDGRLDRSESRFDDLLRAIREQGDRLTGRMMMLGLSTTIILAAIKL
ncbi:MAG: hypothetical protein VYB08_01845 [Candidatus Latescibacterota bacterium]|nr:hypothetical protein [Candidatus Latescibacterota bacterium]